MRIGELARQAGVDVQTVRYYEREGLLAAPSRTPSGYRVYGPEHFARLTFVRHCRSLDMPLAEIKRLIDVSRDVRVSCDQVDALVRSHLERVQTKRRALEALEAQLQTLSAQCASGHRVADCGILEELIHAAHGEACACHPGGQGRHPERVEDDEDSRLRDCTVHVRPLLRAGRAPDETARCACSPPRPPGAPQRSRRSRPA